MKKILSQISILLIIIVIGTLSILIPEVKANSVVGLSVPSSVNINSAFNVSLILPENVFSAQANIKVTYSDGTSESKNLVYLSGMSDFSNVVSFTSKKAGNATVTASNIILSDVNNTSIEKGGSKSATFTVVDPNAVTTPPSTGSSSSSGSTSSTPNTSNTPSVTFSDVNETVYLTERCNIRESYSTSSTKIATLNAKTALTRTGVGSNGWSRINYNGKTAYVSSTYLTKTNPNSTNTAINEVNTTVDEVVFTTVNKTMYAEESCNVRESYSTSSKKVGYLNKNQEVKVVGTASNGWSKVEYNNKTAYVLTKLLTSKKSEESNNIVNEVNTVNNVINESNDIVENDQLNEIKEEIGILPEVGNNIANNFTIVFVIASISSSILLVIYLKKFNS